MSGKYVKAAQAGITAATSTGYLTLGAGTIGNFYRDAFVWVTNTGQTNVLCQITEINITANTIGVKLISKDGEPQGGNPLNYGRSNLSAYNGGNVYMDEQLIYNRGENPVT